MSAMNTGDNFDAKDAQMRLIRASYIGMLLKDMMISGMMIMFASHVLGYTSGQTSFLTAVAPLVLLARYPFLDVVNRLPRFRVMLAARIIQLFCVFALFIIPREHLTVPVLMPLAAIFVVTNEFLLNAVFIPTVSEITEPTERGAFLGRLRSRLQTVGLIYNMGILIFVGEELSSKEHRVLLLICIGMLINSIYWLAPLRDTPKRQFPSRKHRSLWNVITTSPLMRRPLAISLVKSLWEWPILLIYLLNAMSMPAWLMSLFIVSRTLGVISSVNFWGRQADRIGFRRTFLYSFGAALGLFPFLLLIPDFAQITNGSPAYFFGVAAIGIFAFFMGVLTAGQNLANTLYFTAHLKEGQGFYALNLLTATTTVFLSGLTALGGYALVTLENSGLATAASKFGGMIWVDSFRVLLILSLSVLLVVGLILSFKIPKRVGVTDQ